MRLPLKILLSCLLTTVSPLNTIACGIHYERLKKDVNKWDIDSIFNNSNLLKSINDSKTIDLNNNSLQYFYEPCFVNKNIEKAHAQNPNVHFLNNVKGVYIPVLPFVNQAIVNYEKYTNNGINGLDNLEKIKWNIKFSYLQLDNRSEIYVKPNSSIESGLINDSDIYHKNDNIPDDATLFTLVFDTSQNTQGYQSVSTTLNLNLIGINGPDKYFGIQNSIKFGVTISWF